VSDEDLRFPPTERREPAKFEPPPWERDQFDELAKARVEPGPAEAGGSEQGSPVPAATMAEQVVEAVRESVKDDPGEGSEAQGSQPAPPIDPKKLEVMLMGLRAEEPRPEAAYWKVTTIAGALCAVIGLAITVWAVVAFVTLTKSGVRGVTLATVLLVFGLGFSVGGIWLVTRTLRQQGVL